MDKLKYIKEIYKEAASLPENAHLSKELSEEKAEEIVRQIDNAIYKVIRERESR